MSAAVTLPPEQALTPAPELAGASTTRWAGESAAYRAARTAPLAEQIALTADPGFDPHLAPDPTPLWNLLDLTPAGRAADWYPKLAY